MSHPPVRPSDRCGPADIVDSPVFVLGCPRSGTTLLTLMLSSHSRIAIPPETRFLLPVFRQHRSFGDLSDRANRRRLGRAVARRGGGTKFGHLDLDPTRVRRVVARRGVTVGTALATPYRLYAADRGKVRWGDKRPGYVRNVPVVQALFPDALFVHLVRDPRDCVASLKQMRWWKRGTVGAVATWVHSVDLAARAARRLPDGVLHEMRYEDLVADPRGELKLLCAFLDEEFEEDMVTPQDEAALLPDRQRGAWHAETQNAVGTQRIGRYAGVLTPAETALVERVCASRMRRFGYEPPSPPAPVPLSLRLGYGWALLVLRLRTAVAARRDERLATPSEVVAYR